MADSVSILKNPALGPGSDYNFLRQAGMQYIESLGNKFWTDYNIHDPGITLLEALCYAITDLGYRASYDIKDLLAAPPSTKNDPDLQALFTAQNILTVNPWTTADYRKLLIDIAGIKNAWLNCLDCPCNGIFLYADCSTSTLQYKATHHPITIKGMYDVKVEFEDDVTSGDLNSGKVLYNFSFLADKASGRQANVMLEMRLPSYRRLVKNNTQRQFFETLHKYPSQFTITDINISGNETDKGDIPQGDLAKALRAPLYATFTITIDPKVLPTGNTLTLNYIPTTIWFASDADRKVFALSDIKNAISDQSISGIAWKYATKIQAANTAMQETHATLMTHRNLCEDFCTIDAVETEDIAICADIDVTADSDIEQVLAQAYYLIDQYFSPDLRFYSLKEMMDAGVAVDEIFNGPVLSNGFIKDDQLATTELKTALYASDIIAILMGIPGVLAVRNFIMSPYDDKGNRLTGEQWVLKVMAGRQPRLYLNGSKMLVFKNGLPFLPNTEELMDTLNVVKGDKLRPKYLMGDNDLPVPTGKYRNLADYYPVQHSLPLTYGVGPGGLPPNVPDMRKAQAAQLKAYLLFYEQLLVSYLEQLSRVKDLFSVSTTVTQTYYSYMFGADDIAGIIDPGDATKSIYTLTDPAKLNTLIETESEFLDRRNRFLDHLMARFGEQFNDYALMLYSYTNSKKVADNILIEDKIAFIEEIPFTSSNRARAFNYKDNNNVCSDKNIAGIKKRIEQVLGIKELEDYVEIFDKTNSKGVAERKWRLKDDNGVVYLVGKSNYIADTEEVALAKAKEEVNDISGLMLDKNNYEVKKSKQWVLTLKNKAAIEIAHTPTQFSKNTDATAFIDTIVAFVNSAIAAGKIFVVEHLLLRPRHLPEKAFPDGDPLLSICIPKDCSLCGDEDPYSFRLTVVMDGQNGIANSGIEFRRFAENTIRMEIPAHLGVKICWVSTDQLNAFEKVYCAWQAELAKPNPNKQSLSNALKDVISEFSVLKSVYPIATLHDCIDGDQENPVYLNQTVIK